MEGVFMATLKDTKIGESVVVKKLNGEGALRQHFLDMGVIPGTEIKVGCVLPYST